MRQVISQTGFINELGPLAEENNGPLIVDDTGYIAPEKLIKNLMGAGALLQHQRNIQYLYEHDPNVNIDDVEIDPTLMKSFDVIDAQVISGALKHKFAQARAEKLKEEALKEASKPVEPLPKNEEKAEASPEK